MEAFITLATNDSYAVGACTWAHSLKRSGTTRQIVIMITTEVSEEMRRVLAKLFDHIEVVDLLHSGDPAHLKLMDRQDLGGTFTKLHCWRLTQYSKAVFMDADTLILKNIDDIFEREEFSAAPDPGWPDCFNSGVFVFRPSLETYGKLLDFAAENGSFDGADQGLLNRFFSDWSTKDISRHLPFLYNCSMWEFYSYLPALREYRSRVRVVHFIGAVKPWHQAVSDQAGDERTVYKNDFLRQWWSAYTVGVQPLLTPDLTKTGVQYQEKFKASDFPLNSVLDGITRISIKFPEPVSNDTMKSYHLHPRSIIRSRYPREHVNPTSDHRLTISPESRYSPIPTSRESSSDLLSPMSSYDKPTPEIPKAENDVVTEEESSEDDQRISASLPMEAQRLPDTLPIEDHRISACPSVEEQEETHIDDRSLPIGMSDQEQHRSAWDHGHIDYLGVDRFDNILAKLDESLRYKKPKAAILDVSPQKKKEVKRRKT